MSDFVASAADTFPSGLASRITTTVAHPARRFTYWRGGEGPFCR
jgi:hypothetical protein